MPAVSDAQRRWANTPAGKRALGSKDAEFARTPGKLPARAPKKKKG